MSPVGLSIEVQIRKALPALSCMRAEHTVSAFCHSLNKKCYVLFSNDNFCTVCISILFYFFFLINIIWELIIFTVFNLIYNKFF